MPCDSDERRFSRGKRYFAIGETEILIIYRYLPFESAITMNRISHFAIFIILTISSCSDKKTIVIQTDEQYEIVDGKENVVAQTIKTVRQKDSLPIAVITKLFNYQNDIRLKYLTGLSKEDGLQEYLMDSIFYDYNGNDTLKKSFVRLAKKWQPEQNFYKRFRSDNKVEYFMTERPNRID